MKKLDHDWPSDTLEMADWVAYISVKTGWLASYQTENLLTGKAYITEKRADWHAETGWLTCWHVTTDGHQYTDNLLTRSNWNIKKLYDWLAVDTLEIADWVADMVKTGWLAGWQTENLLTRNGWHTEKRAKWHTGTGWLTC